MEFNVDLQAKTGLFVRGGMFDLPAFHHFNYFLVFEAKTCYYALMSTSKFSLVIIIFFFQAKMSNIHVKEVNKIPSLEIKNKTLCFN